MSRLTLKELELLNTASAYNGEQHKAICGRATLELIEYKKIEEEFEIEGLQDLKERLEAYKFLANHEMSCVDVEAYNLMLNDLKSYHIIEEELGVDLITLFNTKIVWCKTLVDIKTKELSYQIIDRKLWGVNLEDKEIMVGSPYSFGSHKIKDYGKTWALTKEELL